MSTEHRPKRRHRLRSRNEWRADRFNRASSNECFGDVPAVRLDVSESVIRNGRRCCSLKWLQLLLTGGLATIAAAWMVYSTLTLSQKAFHSNNNSTLQNLDRLEFLAPPKASVKQSVIVPNDLIKAKPDSIHAKAEPSIPKAILQRGRTKRIIPPKLSSKQKVVLENLGSQSSQSSTLQKCSTSVKNQSLVKEMIYWEKYQPMDYQYKAATYDERKYLTFEPNIGDSSSQHMLLETMTVLALTLGRTLVLPPRLGMPDGTIFSYEDVLDWKNLVDKYKNVHVVTTAQFLNGVAMQGNLLNNAKPFKPPDNRVHWDNKPDMSKLFTYLRTVGTIPQDWDPQTCILGIPKDGTTTNLELALKEIWNNKEKTPTYHDFLGKPTPVNAPLRKRLREMTAERSIWCTYSPFLQSRTLLHIPTISSSGGKSLLFVPFYSFFFFEDYKVDLLMKRMVRNELRYKDDIYCAAARIVDTMTSTGTNMAFHALHINSTKKVSWHDIRVLLPIKSSVFIMTENDNPVNRVPVVAQLGKDYTLYFASDFTTILSGLNHIPLILQLVCARSTIFIGTFESSFSGTTNRFRGYYSNNTSGNLDSTYYHSTMKQQMVQYRSIRKPFYMREWPIAWRDIDHI